MYGERVVAWGGVEKHDGDEEDMPYRRCKGAKSNCAFEEQAVAFCVGVCLFG